MAEAEPTYEGLNDMADELFATGKLATPEQRAKLSQTMARLLNPYRGSEDDFGDPASSGFLSRRP